MAAGVFALAPVGRVVAQAAPEQMPNAAPDPAASPMQSEYTLPLLPRVTCDHDQLFIEADNATLVSVLAAVESCLGVQIKPPAGFHDERTFTHLGPGRADLVLDDLLSTLDVNYSIVLSNAAGRKITGVVLTSRAADNADDKGEASSPATPGLPITGARRLWLASQMSSGRPASATEQPEEPPKDSEPTATTPASRGIPEGLTQAAASPASPADGTAGAAQSGAAGVAGVTAQKDDAAAVPNTSQAIGAATPGANQAAAAASLGGITGGTAAAPAAPSTTPTAPDAAADPKANVLGQQINQMQQMFEQRRKLNAATPPATQDPQ